MKWFAVGHFDSLGVNVEDEQVIKMVVSQKAELTRISDTNGDGRADRFDTLFDAHCFHGNYHTYMHWPARDDEGNILVVLNLAHADQAVYTVGGHYMGRHGSLRCWDVTGT